MLMPRDAIYAVRTLYTLIPCVPRVSLLPRVPNDATRGSRNDWLRNVSQTSAITLNENSNDRNERRAIHAYCKRSLHGSRDNSKKFSILQYTRWICIFVNDSTYTYLGIMSRRREKLPLEWNWILVGRARAVLEKGLTKTTVYELRGLLMRVAPNDVS